MTVMSLREKFSSLIWPVAIAAAFGFTTLCVLAGPEGGVGGWMLVAAALTAALTIGLTLNRSLPDQIVSYRRRDSSLAGPRVRARLPS